MVFLSGCTTVGADLEAGKQARRSEDFATAVRHLQPLAAFGIDEAKYELALALLEEKDVSPEDLQKARALLIDVQGERRPQAMFEVARLYEKGLGVDVDIVAAKDYYKMAGDLGYPRGYAQLASILEKEKDFVSAEGLYKHAFYNQYYKAAIGMGRLLEKGKGRPQDLVEALAWYMAAQCHGVQEAGENIERVSLVLVPEDIARSAQVSVGLEKNEKK